MTLSLGWISSAPATTKPHLLVKIQTTLKLVVESMKLFEVQKNLQSSKIFKFIKIQKTVRKFKNIMNFFAGYITKY